MVHWENWFFLWIQERLVSFGSVRFVCVWYLDHHMYTYKYWKLWKGWMATLKGGWVWMFMTLRKQTNVCWQTINLNVRERSYESLSSIKYEKHLYQWGWTQICTYLVLVRRKIRTAIFPHGKYSSQRKCLTAKIPYGEISVWWNFRTAKNPTAKIPTVEIPTVKIPSAFLSLSPATYHLPPSTCHLPPATCHLPPATCHLPFATCHLSPSTYHRPPFTDHWPSTTDHRTPTTDHRQQVTCHGDWSFPRRSFPRWSFSANISPQVNFPAGVLLARSFPR